MMHSSFLMYFSTSVSILQMIVSDSSSPATRTRPGKSKKTPNRLHPIRESFLMMRVKQLDTSPISVRMHVGTRVQRSAAAGRSTPVRLESILLFPADVAVAANKINELAKTISLVVLQDLSHGLECL
eukprot:Selendium_serpulae@DN6159_c2_g1_i14.p1